MKKMMLTTAFALAITGAPASAQLEGFETGPVFTDFGPKVLVDTDVNIAQGTIFKIAFDVKDKSKNGKLNRSFESAARFINMHVAAGVPRENIKLAVVVHGKASLDLLNDAAFGARYDGVSNSSAQAIAELLKYGVDIHLCGQSAAAYKINKSDLLPGIQMSLSAMTSHALFQQQGYTLNPF